MNRIPLLATLVVFTGSATAASSCSSEEGPRPPAVAPWPAAAAQVPLAPRPRVAATAPVPVAPGDPWSESCTVSGATVLTPGAGADPERMRSLVAGFEGDRGLLAWPAGADRFEAVLVDRELCETKRIAGDLAGGARLFDALPLAGGVALLAHDLCPDGKQFQKCLHARLIRWDGPPGPPVTVRTKEWIQGWSTVAVSPAALVTLRSHVYENPVVERWTAAVDGSLAVERIRALEGSGGPSSAPAFTASGAGWHAAVANGNGAWRLIDSDGRETRLGFVPGGARVDALIADGDGLAVVFTPVGGNGKALRPRLVRLGADRAAIEPPRPLGDDEQLPGGLEQLVRPVLELRGKELQLVRRNGAGFPVGRPTLLGPAPLGHGPDEPVLRAFAAGSGRFGAVWSGFEGDRFVVRLALVTCGK